MFTSNQNNIIAKILDKLKRIVTSNIFLESLIKLLWSKFIYKNFSLAFLYIITYYTNLFG